jgi:hypothetical protein
MVPNTQPSCPGRFIPEDIYRGAQWVESWVGPRAIVDVGNKKENFVSDVIPTTVHILCTSHGPSRPLDPV